MIINLRNWKNDVGHTLYSGTCGATAYWTLSDTGYLLIYGEGAMTDYTSATTMPWYSYLSQIKTIIISGITHIGNYAFYGCTALISITIPDSVTSIGSSCFSGCTAVTSVTFKGAQPTLGSQSFYLGSLQVPATATVYSNGWANATVFTSTVIGNYTTLTYVTV